MGGCVSLAVPDGVADGEVERESKRFKRATSTPTAQQISTRRASTDSSNSTSGAWCSASCRSTSARSSYRSVRSFSALSSGSLRLSTGAVFTNNSWSPEDEKAPKVLAPANPAVSLVNVIISCTNLPSTVKRKSGQPLLSKPSGCIVTVLLERVAGRWMEAGRTCTVLGYTDSRNARNADRHITVQYCFARVQLLKVVIFRLESIDLDSGPCQKHDLSQHTSIAEVKFLMSELFTSGPGVVVTKLLRPTQQTAAPQLQGQQSPPAQRATCYLSAKEVPQQNDQLLLRMAARNLAHPEGSRQDSRPFLRISRQGRSKRWTSVFATEVKKNRSNPVFDEFELSMSQLDNTKQEQQLKVEALLWRGMDAEPHILGSALTSACAVRQLAAAKQNLLLPSLPTTQTPDGKQPAELVVNQFTVQPRNTFIDYIEGGCQLCLMVAVDLSGVAGMQPGPAMLHHFGAKPEDRSTCEQLILNVGRVMKPYCGSQKVACWGIGASLTKKDLSQQYFPLNGSPLQPELPNADAVCQAYRDAARNVKASGSAAFAPIIDAAAEYISRRQPPRLDCPPRQYCTLMIVTDREPADVPAALAAIWDCSDLPMSVLVMGVGTHDMSDLKALNEPIPAPAGGRDKEQPPTCNAGFVQVKPTDSGSGAASAAQKLLTKLPQQLLQYYAARKITPNDLLTVEEGSWP